MPSVSTTTTVETTVELTPELRTKLQTKLRRFADAKKTLDEAQDALDALKGDIADLREIAGYKALDLPGYGSVTLVEGTSSKLDKKKLLAQGITLAQIETATVTKPKKPYVLVTPAGETPKRHSTEDEE